jgi:dihydrodipicolinate synthase/N-acetylneuraminate lyase
MPARTSPDEIRARLLGPVASIPTPFAGDGAIHWDGVAQIIETAIAGGSGVVLLTVGDSQFFFMTEEEIAALTRFVIARTAGRALTVAATGPWATRQAVPFAACCREWGADVVMSLAPAMMTAGQGLVAHYRALAAIMPVMIVGAPEMGVVNQLVDEPNICCFKEDGSEAYAIALLQQHGRTWQVMTGGGLYRHLFQWPFGARAFMDWSTSFAPQVGRHYWNALQTGDLTEAERITREIEKPLFDLCAQGLDWQALWRTLLELNGIAPRHLRGPMPTLDDAAVERLQPVLHELGLCP